MTAVQHPTLLVLDDPNRGAVLVIDEVLSDFSVGSDEGCHLFLSGEDVSPLHARFFLDDEGRVSVCDTNSRAGVFVNGGQVMEQALDDGDEISLGDPSGFGCRRLRFVARGSEVDLDRLIFATSEIAVRRGAPLESLPDLVEPPPAADLSALDTSSPLEFLAPLDPEPVSESLLQLEPLPDGLFDAAPETVVEIPQDVFEDPLPDLIPELPSVAPPAPSPLPKPPALPKPSALPKQTGPVSSGLGPTSAAAVPKSQTGRVTKPVPPLGDRDDPLAGLAESLGGSTGQKFVPPPVAAPPATKAPAKERKTSPVVMAARVIGIAAILGGAAWYGLGKYAEAIGSVVIDTYLPNPVEPGQNLTINGLGFGTDPAALSVRLGKTDLPVLDTNGTRINVAIPESLGAQGSQTVQFQVVLSDKSSTGRLLKIAAIPKIAAITPRVALAGDEIVIGGRWLSNPKAKPTVTIGGGDAEVLEASPATIRVKVPSVGAAQGQKLLVRVSVGSDLSKEVPLVNGQLPFIDKVAPERAFPGEVVTLSGLGLSAADPEVRVSGHLAVVLAATDVELKISVPGGRLSEGAGVRELLVQTGEKTSAPASLDVRRDSAALYSPRFFAERLSGGRIAVSCELGPVMVLGADPASGQRAHSAAGRLNALSLKGRENRVIFGSTDASITTAGTPVLVVAPGDGSGAPRALASVWAAQLTDMFDLFLQGRRPGRAIDLSPDGKAFVDIFAAARRRSTEQGVPLGLLSSLDPAWQRSLAMLASAPTFGSSQANYVIDGYWAGVLETKGAIQAHKVEISLSATDRGVVGQRTSRQGGLSTDVTLQGLTYSNRELRFSFIDSGKTLTYVGRLDGDTIDGAVSGGDASGKLVFKLSR